MMTKKVAEFRKEKFRFKFQEVAKNFRRLLNLKKKNIQEVARILDNGCKDGRNKEI